MKAPCHVDMLKADPEMANMYLATTLKEVNLPGGQFALLVALRHIAEAQRHYQTGAT
jgi:hypothetical protein